MVGSHDKSDWILYKTNNLSEEIAASRDDVVNKTTCPSKVLEAFKNDPSANVNVIEE